jgi:hypothetical protein
VRKVRVISVLDNSLLVRVKSVSKWVEESDSIKNCGIYDMKVRKSRRGR